MNALQEFRFNENQVRVVIKDGAPWWLLTDVCSVLGIANVGNVSLRLDDDEKSTIHLADSDGGLPRVIINESGLYNVILRSDKPEARRFKKWVTSEVLPQIRKRGSYSLPSDPHDQVLMLCEKLTAMTLEAKQLINKVNEQETKLIEQAPKVSKYDQFVNSDGLISVNTASKLLKVGFLQLYCWLKVNNYLCADKTRSTYNSPYNQYTPLHQNLFDVKLGVHKEGKTEKRDVPHSTTFFTPKGLDRIDSEIKNVVLCKCEILCKSCEARVY